MKVYILWKYPTILGIYTEKQLAEEEGDRLAAENGLKKVVAYWVNLIWWSNNNMTICIEEMEANKAASFVTKEGLTQ